MPPSASATPLQLDLWPLATLTTEASRTCAPTISEATHNATSLLASASGPTPCAAPGGPTIARSGPAPVPANLSARQAKALGLLTSGTFGPPGIGSSSSIALASSLASRLKARTAGCGSILYQLTWKQVATPAGRSYSLLRASGHRTSDTGCTGWPTPTVGNADGSQAAAGANATGRRPDGSKATVSLNAVSLLAGWPTATVNDSLKGGHITPRPGMMCLVAAAQTAGWATPAARDWRTPKHQTLRERGQGAKGEQLQNQVAHTIPGAALNGLPAQTANSGLLNPAFSAWLQGIPPAWSSCFPPPKPPRSGPSRSAKKATSKSSAPTATPSTPSSPPK